MILKNLIIGIFLITALSGCAQNTALLGPAYTLAKSGNIYQAGLSYGSSHVIKKTKESLEKVKKTKKIVYHQVGQLQKKIKRDKLNKVVVKDQADLFFKAVKDNLKKYN